MCFGNHCKITSEKEDKLEITFISKMLNEYKRCSAKARHHLTEN